jgi:hypothetical protein
VFAYALPTRCGNRKFYASAMSSQTAVAPRPKNTAMFEKIPATKYDVAKAFLFLAGTALLLIFHYMTNVMVSLDS